MEFNLETTTQIKTSRRKRFIFCGIVAAVAAFFVGFAIGYVAFKYKDTSQAKSSEVESSDRRLENGETQDRFLKSIDSEKIGESLRYFSSKVHLAGSPRAKELAEYLAGQWKDYGFDKVEMPEYKVLTSQARESQPNMITIEGHGYIDYRIEGKMKIYPDPRVNKTVDFYPFFGYSPNKTVIGDLVYVNYGMEEDYKTLKKMNISVEGKIVMSKYAFAITAANHGAIGLIIFPDVSKRSPSDETYPNGPWLSSEAVQMQSSFRKPYVGDKLTPGVPANDGMYRMSYSNDSSIPTIPVQPISYGQAMEIFKRMKGADAPASWQIPLFKMKLKTGPGFHNDSLKIKMQVNTQKKMVSIYNVIGTITGSEEPDRYVIIGNHRDSWVLGAVDALSGTSTTHEIARVLGKLKSSGWRPRRTIKICSWGGEEWGLFGSTEWVEENSKELSSRAVGYINLDIAVQGDFVLRARASPLFKELTYKWAKKVKDPTAVDDKTSMFDTWLRRTPSSYFPGEPELYNNFRSSDYVMFYDFLGIPASDYGYWYGYRNNSYMYPVYHTTEDTFYWLQNFVDPEFLLHKGMSQFAGGVLLDLADSPILPYDVVYYGQVLNISYTILDNSNLLKGDIFLREQMKYLYKAIQEFIQDAKQFEQRMLTTLKTVSKSSNLKLRMLNDQIVSVEQAFILPSGLLGKPYDRHSAFNFGFKNIEGIRSTFPGVTDSAYKAIASGDWEPVRHQMSLVLNSVRMAIRILKSDV